MDTKKYKLGFKKAIEEYMQNHNLSLYAFSRDSGIDYKTLKNMVNGTSIFIYNDLVRLSSFMGFNVTELLSYIEKFQ